MLRLAGFLGRNRGVNGPGVGLQRAQHVGNVLERVHHRGAVLRGGLRDGFLGGLLFVKERAGIEHGLRRVASDGPEQRARREQA